MIKNITNKKPKKEDEAVVGELRYGALITEVSGHPDSIYIKVSKKTGKDVELTWSRNHSILLNLRTGGLRCIKGATVVKVLEGDLIVQPGSASQYEKVYY